MGMPEVVINFKESKDTFVYRLGRGTVCWFVADSEKSTAEKHLIRYKGDSDKELAGLKNSETVIKQVKRMFDFGVKNVIVVACKDLDTAKTLLEQEKYNYLAIESADEGALTWAKDIGYRAGKHFILITDGAASLAKDESNVVSVYPESKTIELGKPSDIASIIASVNDRSATYYVLANNTELTDEEIAKYPARKAASAKVDEGALVVFNDGEKLKIARAVTTYYKGGEDIGNTSKSPFSKIRAVDIANMIMDDIETTFENEYSGKVINTYDNKMNFISMINAVYLAGLVGTALSGDFENVVDIDLQKHVEIAKQQGMDVDSMSEIDLRTIDTGDKVYLAGHIHIVDTMEDLYINFSI